MCQTCQRDYKIKKMVTGKQVPIAVEMKPMEQFRLYKNTL